MKNPKMLAISGVKNSGKTTLMTKLIPELVKQGLKIATIKHDGHGFTADSENSDSFRHKAAGAYGTAVLSDSKYMLVKELPECDEVMVSESFPEADLILLEGFKHSPYPKIEIIRSENSQTSICQPDTLIAIVSDLPLSIPEVPVFGLNDIHLIAQFIYKWVSRN
ncbi:molybdopterin-guanine dinucleotide biosynthesis protein B [Acetobacterium sp.]|uniref:molybdopterin-guanine dinucleotide biosynthesis protein B n=1 Tax=Acetobacterium sp. TaxID=1872094 RepID=UPI002F40D041